MNVVTICSEDLTNNVCEIEDNPTEESLRKEFGFDDVAEYVFTEKDGRRVHSFYNEEGYRSRGFFIIE